jgi:hypothetical protein
MFADCSIFKVSGEANMKPVGWRLLARILCPVILAAQASWAADITPQSVEAILPELDRLADQTLKKTGVPGMAIAVVCMDQVIHQKQLFRPGIEGED